MHQNQVTKKTETKKIETCRGAENMLLSESNFKNKVWIGHKNQTVKCKIVLRTYPRFSTGR